ncbi:methyltransferase family protein [Maribellus sediminis]|uniref:methyltransferase family protein n=1 Tax=Maribellus sediminis TaxID=2696285 RepID=UPI00142FCC6D|nr:isoprenylcysteine carboxylmethyltransferase family protein [Maribellus sediminis]
MKDTAKYILGYSLGVVFFIVLIPLIIYCLSYFDNIFQGKVLIYSKILRLILSIIVFLVGAVFVIWSNVFLYKIGKGGPTEGFGVAISPPTKKLVTTGPYKYSRNPMVFGAYSIYTSIVIVLNSIIGLIFLACLILISVLYLKRSEEKRLERDFREDYLEYKKKVPMIFPIKFYTR